MGISGLLPFLKKASRPANVEEFSGQSCAIDVYCWLHKGAFGCADKLVQNQPTDGYIVYVMRYLDMLMHFNVKPILVFDGRNLPSKSETEKKRRENRDKYRKMAKAYLREGKVREARECFQRCVDITPSMAREVIEACRERNIDCIVAPYEADAQLAYLNIAGIADFVISEDSDLAPFGCTKILFKMDSSGNGTLIEKDKLHLCLGQRADNFTFDKFRYMCIMAGCDYLPSLPGIGIGKSCKFWGKVTNPDLRSVLPKIPSYLNMNQLDVTEDYIKGFFQANDTFLYQLVYDPVKRKQRPLVDYPANVNRSSGMYSFAGAYLDEDLAYQMALGNVDLHSLDVVGFHDPDQESDRNDTYRPRYGKKANHFSIWWSKERQKRHLSTDWRDEATKRKDKMTEFQKTFSLPTSSPNPIAPLAKKRRLAESIDDDDEAEVSEAECDVIKIYSKKKIPKLEDSTYSCRNEISICHSVANKSIVSKEGDNESAKNVVYVSKYFTAKEKPRNLKQEPQILTVKTPEKQPTKRKTGDWLSELENAVGEDDDSTIAIRNSDVSKENCQIQLTKISALPPLKNNPDSRKPFKPVIVFNKKPEDENRDQKRNPFAKKIQSFSQPNSINSSVSQDSGYFFQTPLEVSSSQISVSSLASVSQAPGGTSACDSLAGASASESLGDSQTSAAAAEMSSDKNSSPKSETESPYFSSKRSTFFSQPATSKPRVPFSGLLKRSQPKKSDSKQPKLFDLWGKNK